MSDIGIIGAGVSALHLGIRLRVVRSGPLPSPLPGAGEGLGRFVLGWAIVRRAVSKALCPGFGKWLGESERG